MVRLPENFEMMNIAPEGEPPVYMKRYRDTALPWDHKLIGVAACVHGGYDIVVVKNGCAGHKRIAIEDRDVDYWRQRAEVENG